MLPVLYASTGDLLEIVAWECEGTESPWGFRAESIDGIPEVSGSQFRKITRRNGVMVALQPGETCIVLKSVARNHPAIDPIFIVLIRGMQLGVYTRFLKKI